MYVTRTRLRLKGFGPELHFRVYLVTKSPAGRIDAIGKGIEGWKVGQRAALGWFGGECGECEACRRGDIVNCPNQTITGITTDGGYAEVVVAEARAVAAMPDDLSAEDAAPLMCAGTTV